MRDVDVYLLAVDDVRPVLLAGVDLLVGGVGDEPEAARSEQRRNKKSEIEQLVFFNKKSNFKHNFS